MSAPARRAAYEVLRTVSDGRGDLPDALARVRSRLTDDRDRALVTEIATGTLRWRAALDHLIASAANRRLDRLDPEVLDILRLSVYQLLHLDRVPAAAVVDDAVTMTRGAGKGSAAGFVNAVLRRVSRTRPKASTPAPPGNPADRESALEYLSVSGSHPRWLVERWLERHGYERTRAWVAFDNEPAPLTLRAITRRVSRDDLARRLRRQGVDTTACRYARDGLVVSSGNPLRAPLATEGLFVMQDEASQIVPLMAGARAGERVLDACAAPGGKTVALADVMRGDGLIVAGDVRERRVALLRRTLADAGVAARLVRLDASRGVPFGAVFDRVLADVPCSGLGTLRRDPDIRWRRAASDLPRYARLEAAILAGAAGAVRPGGRLVYATCSSESDENETVVERFLEARGGWRRVPAGTLIEEGVPADLLSPAGDLRTWPFAHGLEAFYAAALERNR